LLTLQNCTEPFIEFVGVPIEPNANQILDNFLNDQSSIEEQPKEMYDVEKVFIVSQSIF
jgi:hypothetical protein